MLKRKDSRRSSAQYYVSAEDHVENEVKHERLLTETSRLSSSWASLSVSGSETTAPDHECAPTSGQNSPSYRSHSFSGPLVISVTCSSQSCSSLPGCCPTSSRATSTSPAPAPLLSSGHVSPVASPISSKVQCYSPGLSTVPPIGSPIGRRNNIHAISGVGAVNCSTINANGAASPLLVSAAVGRKRCYFSSINSGGSSDDASREGSPDPLPWSRASKSMRQSDPRGGSITSDLPQLFRWPPGSALISNPPSPSCQLFSANAIDGTTSNSPSTSSLPSPRLSLFSSSSTALPGACPLSPNCFTPGATTTRTEPPFGLSQQQRWCSDSTRPVLNVSTTSNTHQRQSGGSPPVGENTAPAGEVEASMEQEEEAGAQADSPSHTPELGPAANDNTESS